MSYGPSHLEVSKEGISIREENRKPSPRQQHVIELVAKGLKNREIAKRLGIGEHVVRNSLGIIYDKVGVSNRVELALWYEARVHEDRFRFPVLVLEVSRRVWGLRLRRTE